MHWLNALFACIDRFILFSSRRRFWKFSFGEYQRTYFFAWRNFYREDDIGLFEFEHRQTETMKENIRNLLKRKQNIPLSGIETLIEDYIRVIGRDWFIFSDGKETTSRDKQKFFASCQSQSTPFFPLFSRLYFLRKKLENNYRSYQPTDMLLFVSASDRHSQVGFHTHTTFMSNDLNNRLYTFFFFFDKSGQNDGVFVLFDQMPIELKSRGVEGEWLR